jgi:hypothetical protein
VSAGAPVAARIASAVGLLLLAACGGGGSAGEHARGLPTCLRSLSPSSVPQDGSFPRDWPFPPHTVVTDTQKAPGGGIAVTAQVGAEFEKVLPFMQHDLEDAGFVATKGEAERDDAEAVWSGKGFAGTWAIKSSETCKGTTLLQVAAARQ